MDCRGKELISLFLYKICNPKKFFFTDKLLYRSDYKIEERVEEVDELKSEAELERLRTLLENEEAENKRLRRVLENEEAENKSVRLRTISECNNGPSKNEITNEDFYLPSDLVVVILSRLAFKENLRFSAVCKTWAEIAASVRVRDQPCWLMYIDPYHINGVSYGFFDPIEKKKTKAMNLPELSKSSEILCSNDGWLLMKESASRFNHFFFNHFTRERINLPNFDTLGITRKFAFSCAPTKKGCLMFAINAYLNEGAVLTITTCHPGATTWVNECFPNVIPSCPRHIGNIYSEGVFYVALENVIRVFDPCAHTWNVLPVKLIPSPSPKVKMHMFSWITEYKGEIFLVDASTVEPMVFRLNRLESVWEKKETLDGSSIFVSNGSCMMASGLTGSMSNIVYFWDSDICDRRPSKYYCCFNSNRPYKYSIYSRSLCEDTQGYYFEYRIGRQMGGVWIQPPPNISIFDFSILPSHLINMRLFI